MNYLTFWDVTMKIQCVCVFFASAGCRCCNHIFHRLCNSMKWKKNCLSFQQKKNKIPEPKTGGLSFELARLFQFGVYTTLTRGNEEWEMCHAYSSSKWHASVEKFQLLFGLIVGIAFVLFKILWEKQMNQMLSREIERETMGKMTQNRYYLAKNWKQNVNITQ